MRSVLLVAALLLSASEAGAVARTPSEYPFEQVFNSAVRLVRVDLGFEVLERDAEAGFLLFKYRGDSGVFNASIEIIRGGEGGRVGIVVQVPEMPRYTELWLMDKLQRKMREEYGAPPPRPRPAAERPAAPREGTADRAGRGGTTRPGRRSAASPGPTVGR